jgi:hypothetical protein
MKYDLKQPVLAAIATEDRLTWANGVVIARTIEGEPRYDVRLETGLLLNNLPDWRLREYGEATI